ncbi:hypothetical protein A2272_06795 [Candidatus Peregrinibacteria bacterium RIFOXYA12_FULL_33_12]|nr:MAG: hypothetical protein A2263_00430 [Candidatus Peregrinibacteria bacterium RIFOXYA2_FULL_33_21]OGJ46895.1 MAG: hypothetical protein A2272_06795 [Candidatus Peregrinibacteria bacterium RIFOXYA12_FULL_33_12]OGJ51759.1 MAG: hypothetical protein A2307_05865 [Candidatus Peregrinibacteria bacterium RIFOXYB2_FULL_33_20]
MNKLDQPSQKPKKILFGVCGIGSGHTNRQLPLIEHFARSQIMMIFAYGESYKFYSQKFKDNSTVSVTQVAVPFYIGEDDGLGFNASLKRPENQGRDFFTVNCQAMAQAKALIGRPDLVVSDYEPVCAQYAYAYNSPLITFDQQSKYLIGKFPGFDGLSYNDEIMRLRMFFPKVHTRIACSFFKVEPKDELEERVIIYPPVIKDKIALLERKPGLQPSILVYISSQQEFAQSQEEIAGICGRQREAIFHVFSPTGDNGISDQYPNVFIYKHGDSRFTNILSECTGIISTAGHTLLSEAMYLGIPVYAMPFRLFEQQMNAYIIDHYGFGVSHHCLDQSILAGFVENIPKFRNAIKNDNKILMRGIGQQAIIEFLENEFLS